MTQATGNGLYLHGGPGLNAEVERQWFEGRVGLDWWSQPAIAPTDVSPLQSVVDAAKARLVQLNQRHGGRVYIVSHSVGAVIAVQLLREAPDLIASATLINPIFDLTEAMVGLARRLISDGIATPPLSEAMQRPVDRRTGFVDLAVMMASVPARFDLYWSPSSGRAKDRYIRLSPNGPAVDFDAFTRVGAAIQDLAPSLYGIKTSVPVRAIVGAHDPMMPQDALAYVHERLPLATVSVVDAGHMATFEQPQEAWRAQLQRTDLSAPYIP